MSEDKTLVKRLEAGDPTALELIYKKYKNEMLALGFTLANDISAAEDAVHDVFLKFARSVAAPSGIKNLKRYLATSVANTVRSHQRYKHRHQTTGLDKADTLSSNSCKPERWLVLNEELELLAGALAQLPYEQREVITLHMHSDMSLRKIAAFQNESPNTVAGRYRYALRKLRSLLDSETEK